MISKTCSRMMRYFIPGFFRTGCNPDHPPGSTSAATAARAALPDANVSTATDSRIPSNNARTESRRAFSARHFPCCLRAGFVPDGSARLAAVLHLLHKPERFCGTASFTVFFLKRTALTEENRHPFLDPETPCFLTPLPPEHKLIAARSVLRSVTTGESLVLYVFAVFAPLNIHL